MQIIVEPEATFAQRHASTPEDSFAFTQTDPHIFKQLRAGPLHAMTLLNLVARQMPARCKRVRVAVKREILLRLGTLIRLGQLVRVRRKFIAMP